MTGPGISVIIPVYNAQDYLAECIESVLQQSFQDFEVICVDDGSNDNSGFILKKYAEKDKRIVIISQINKGVSIARNVALEKARGKYVYFLDSDDYIETDTLQVSYQELEGKMLDAVYFDTVAFGEEDFSEEFIETKNKYYARKHDYPAIYPGIDLLCNLLENHEYTCPIWKQVIRRDLLTEHKISFYDGIIHQDELYTIQTMMLAKRVLYLHRVLHHRRLRKNSIMTKPLDFHSVYSYFFCVKAAYKFLVNQNCDQRKMGLIIGHLKRLSVLARSQYSKLTDTEQEKYIGFSEEDKFLFELCIADSIGTLKQRDRLNIERQNYIKERETRSQQLDDLRARAALLEQSKAEALKQLQASEDALVKERETNSKRIEEIQARAELLDDINNKRIKEIQTRTALLEQAKAEALKQLQSSQDTLAKERETSSKQIEEIQARTALLEQTKEEALKQLQSSKDTLAKERETSSKRIEEIQARAAQIEQLEASVLKQLYDTEAVLTKEREVSQKQTKELKSKIELLGIEKEKITKQSLEVTEALSKEKEIKRNLEKELQQMRERIVKTGQELVLKEKMFSEESYKNGNLEKELQQLKQQLEHTKKLQRETQMLERKKEKEVIKLSRHLNDVKTGWSFRTGRVITYIPRKIRDFFKK